MLSSDSSTGFPPILIVPEEALIRPAMRFNSVVLPHPDGPTNEINSFLYRLNEIPLSAAVSQDIV